MTLISKLDLISSIVTRIPEMQFVDPKTDPDFWARLMVKRIVQLCHPVMIILFGPCVGGNPLHTEAYYNLLVIFSELVDVGDMYDTVRDALAGITLEEFILCATLRELEDDDDPNDLRYIALTEGKVIYSNLRPSDLDIWLLIIVKRIVKYFYPVKIIVFGAYVMEGEFASDSRLNLVVVFPELLNARKMNSSIGNFLEDIPVEKSIFSTTLNDLDGLHYFALTQGRVIYDVQSDINYWIVIMVKRIVEWFHPVRLILLEPCFGGGERNIESDVDLVVIFPELSNVDEINISIRNTLSDIPVNYNLYPMTLTEFEYHLNNPGSFYYTPLTDRSKVIYDHDVQYRLKSNLNYWIFIMVKRIVERFQPVRIILLGPCFSGGETLANGDVNLVVVFSELSDENEMRIEIRNLLADVPVDYDIFPTTLRELEAHFDEHNSLYYLALREGKIIHERES